MLTDPPTAPTVYPAGLIALRIGPGRIIGEGCMCLMNALWTHNEIVNGRGVGRRRVLQDTTSSVEYLLTKIGQRLNDLICTHRLPEEQLNCAECIDRLMYFGDLINGTGHTPLSVNRQRWYAGVMLATGMGLFADRLAGGPHETAARDASRLLMDVLMRTTNDNYPEAERVGKNLFTIARGDGVSPTDQVALETLGEQLLYASKSTRLMNPSDLIRSAIQAGVDPFEVAERMVAMFKALTNRVSEPLGLEGWTRVAEAAKAPRVREVEDN